MADSLGLNILPKHKGVAAKRKRVCRGIGSGTGKTGGRGYNGQKSRSGGSIPAAFEGGQMPLHMRVPKFGFTAHKNINALKLPSRVLNGFNAELEITIENLLEANLIKANTSSVKFYLAGEISNQYKVTDERIRFSKGCSDFLSRQAPAPQADEKSSASDESTTSDQ